MSVSNGQIANATTFNTAFLSRTVDTSTVAEIALNDASYTAITSTQGELNGLDEFTGRAQNAGATSIPTYTNNEGFTPSDPLFDRLDDVSGKFHSSTGHAHTGAAGDGAPIAAADISATPLRGYYQQGTDLTGVTGTSTDVSTQLTGKTDSSGTNDEGVVVTGPFNKVILRYATGTTQDDEIVSALGDQVYGRLTFSLGVWTLSYYTLVSGTETAYSFSSTNVRWYYQELYNPLGGNAPVYSELASIPSDNPTADIVDATSTQRGLVSTGTQTFGGVKTFADDVVFQESIATEREDVASAATITALSSDKSFVKITGATATLIQGVTAGVNGQVLVIHNGASADVTLVHQSGSASAANRLKLPSATDITVSPDSSAELIYDTAQSRWVIKSGSGTGGGGSFETFATQSVGSGGTITSTTADGFQMRRVQGSGGAQTTSTTPFGADPGWTDGTVIRLVGQSDSNTLTVPHNDATDGAILNGDAILGAFAVLTLQWDDTAARWFECGRVRC